MLMQQVVRQPTVCLDLALSYRRIRFRRNTNFAEFEYESSTLNFCIFVDCASILQFLRQCRVSGRLTPWLPYSESHGIGGSAPTAQRGPCHVSSAPDQHAGGAGRGAAGARSAAPVRQWAG